jgi:hypothetical protein
MKADLINNKKSKLAIRKAFSIRDTVNINLPKSIARRAGIRPLDYVCCEYNDLTNEITFKRLDLKSSSLAKGEGE